MTRPLRRGLTLVEVAVSILLVSTILLASLTASASLMRNQAQSRRQNEARSLGSVMLDEITSQSFQDQVQPTFGLEADESAGDRTTFDDVDDYHEYGQSSPTHRDGTVMDAYAGWSYSIRVLPVLPDADGVTTTGASSDSSLRLIQVRCTSPEGGEIVSAALVSDCVTDATETTSYERWRRLELQFSDREIIMTTPLRNQPEPIYSP
jgi:type II secretory pathway pseudopilin PulG